MKMSLNFVYFCLALLLGVLLNQAETAQGNKLGRQRQAPYPAAGFRPEIPFELPTKVSITTTSDALAGHSQKVLPDQTTTLPQFEYITTENSLQNLPPTTPEALYGPPSTNELEEHTKIVTENYQSVSSEVEQLDLSQTATTEEFQEFELLSQVEPRLFSRFSIAKKTANPIK